MSNLAGSEKPTLSEERQVFDELNRLDSSINSAISAFCDLRKRLAVVCVQPTTGEHDEQPEAELCPLANQIKQERTRLVFLADDIRLATKLLQV